MLFVAVKLLDSPMFTKLQSEEHCVTDCDCLGHCFRKCSLVAACCSDVGWHKPFHQAWQPWSGEHQRGQCCCAVCARVSVPLLQHQGILNNHWSACCGGQPVLDALVGPCVFDLLSQLLTKALALFQRQHWRKPLRDRVAGMNFFECLGAVLNELK